MRLGELLGVGAVVVVAFWARGRRSLAPSGATAAVVVGASAALADWRFAALLLVFFASATALSRVGREAKRQLTGAIVEKGDERDAWQVLANGGVFAAAALVSLLRPGAGDAAMAAAAGALAAACADTWSTEIGTLSLSPPRSIITGRVVPPGTSGGVTKLGYAGMVAGAVVIGVTSTILGWSGTIAAAAVFGGITGALADSFIGARWQSRRRCPKCDALTERAVHDCGTGTEPAGGFAWLDNDGVNALATIIGAGAALGGWAALR